MSRVVTSLELSKTISHALRHEPWLYELELDAQGWTRLDVLIESLRSKGGAWTGISRKEIDTAMISSDKVRFEVEGDRIRALYGHSTPKRLDHSPTTPPSILYHGTSPRSVGTIMTDGLKPMSRQYVHLSTDRETAELVGRRKADEPVILVIDAGGACEAGVLFYLGNDKVWLADAIPTAFIRR